ncbi:hypothetical protein GCM10010412_095660 [Nonomuraea recticatena]|uniref:Uncharacterized protein n=1 Tax=Nonomuraea recticatena TaxID=46178 RepID=A0ABN3TDZ8_9ACTN
MFVISDGDWSLSEALGCGISEVQPGDDFRDRLISEVKASLSRTDDSPSTQVGGFKIVTALLGRDRPLAEVADTEIGAALTELWGRCAPATWNRNRAAISSWLAWCQAKKHWAAPSVPADAERRKESADETRAVAKTTIHRLLSRRDIPLREKTLGRMLYETAARAAEILALNVEDLDLEHRRAPVRSKGGAVEWVYWHSGTAPSAAPATPAPGRQHTHPRSAVPGRAAPGPRPPSGGRRHLPAHRPRVGGAIATGLPVRGLLAVSTCRRVLAFPLCGFRAGCLKRVGDGEGGRSRVTVTVGCGEGLMNQGREVKIFGECQVRVLDCVWWPLPGNMDVRRDRAESVTAFVILYIRPCLAIVDTGGRSC